jgi:single-strand DNA-binding protein
LPGDPSQISPEKFLVKGTEICVEGKLVNRNYTDKEGNKKYFTEIQVNELAIAW